jgi:hypothetical protein
MSSTCTLSFDAPMQKLYIYQDPAGDATLVPTVWLTAWHTHSGAALLLTLM